jgi:hypothetical protein
MPTCDNCGGHVSTAFARVFSVDGRVGGCLACTNREALMDASKSGVEE